ncbi:Cyclin-L1 [Choanephora cucurbitarum]|uniref:Cyclin-L1 n=1 Tax=Choanephora cucurbitarum TaxID=101091 RepID=A0A1C7NAH5_9FUNG|nr:Cyclin-L1 [Choanephora cucurbitarum]
MSVALKNPLASLEQLEVTISRRDGISEELEEDLRHLGAELIQSAGILLKLPQVAMATAQVLFQRFFYMASLKEFGIVKAYTMKDMAIAAEMQILRKLGFIVHVQLPYNLMINYLRILGLEEHRAITRRAWNYLNDGLRTTIYVTHEPSTIACAAIWLACLEESVKLPTDLGKEWWLLFDVDSVHFKNAAAHIKRLYYRKLDKANLPLYKLSNEQS